MSFTKRFYFAFILLFAVSIVSYISFMQFKPSAAESSKEEVKGSSMEDAFSFIPALTDAEEVSANYSSDGFERTFLTNKECDGSSQQFYANVLKEKGWYLEKSDENEDFTSQTFSKLDKKITISSVSDEQNKECLVHLVGFSTN